MLWVLFDQTHNFHGYPTFQHWLTKVKGQLANLAGVKYVGMVNHIVLARAYARSGFSLYPTSYPETGCKCINHLLASIFEQELIDP